MSPDRTVPLALVSHAAFLAGRGRRWLPGEAPSRWAAMTGETRRGPDCRDWRRSRVMPDRPRLDRMHPGDLLPLAERTHRERGPREVRRIWGYGLRVLQHLVREPMRWGAP